MVARCRNCGASLWIPDRAKRFVWFYARVCPECIEEEYDNTDDEGEDDDDD